MKTSKSGAAVAALLITLAFCFGRGSTTDAKAPESTAEPVPAVSATIATPSPSEAVVAEALPTGAALDAARDAMPNESKWTMVENTDLGDGTPQIYARALEKFVPGVSLHVTYGAADGFSLFIHDANTLPAVSAYGLVGVNFTFTAKDGKKNRVHLDGVISQSFHEIGFTDEASQVELISHFIKSNSVDVRFVTMDGRNMKYTFDCASFDVKGMNNYVIAHPRRKDDYAQTY